MFTGLIDAIGEIGAITHEGEYRLQVLAPYALDSVALGASIACNGACLTVVDKNQGPQGVWFAAEVSAETLAKTTLGGWRVGQKINLERALKVGDELGGHLVSGHVDGVGSLVSITPDGGSLQLVFSAPRDLARCIAPKGSITVDGISLTVNHVDDDFDAVRFGITIIPHTQHYTRLGGAVVGELVNLEIDMLARYVARLQDLNA